MSGTHARLSSSSADRWLNCPGSAREVAKYGDRTSPQAAEGTFAHHIAAECLTDGGSPARWFGNRTIVEEHTIECDRTMVDSVQFYIDDCMLDRQPGDVVMVEASVHDELKTIDPDMGGTADYIRWRPSTRHLLVADAKFGAGVLVMPTDNRQLKSYALGAMLKAKVSPDRVTVRVVQPRIEHPEGRTRDFEFDGMELVAFALELKEAGPKTRDPNAPLVPGYWCRKTFCPAARQCPALQDHQRRIMEETDFAVPALAGPTGPLTVYKVEDLATALGMIEPLKAKIKALEGFAYSEAARGVAIPGWKLVDKRPTRKVVDEAGAVRWAEERGIDPYEPQELKSPAQLEKGQKKADKAALAEYVSAVSSGTTLVQAGDPREEVKLLDDKRDFAAQPVAVEANVTVKVNGQNLFD